MIRYNDQNITEITDEDIKGILDSVPIIPLRNAVVFPGIVLPVFVGRNESIKLVENFSQAGSLIAVFTQKNAESEEIKNIEDLYTIGTLTEVHKVIPMSEGGYQVLLQGVQKIELKKFVEFKPFLKGRVKPLYEEKDFSEEDIIEIQTYVIRYIENNPAIPDDVVNYIKRITNPSALVNQVIFFSNLSNEEKISFLKRTSIKDKIEYTKKYLIDETQRLIMEKEVREKVEQDASRLQREFYLRKQLEVIKKELGETDSGDIDDLEKRINEKKLPEHARKVLEKEYKRYKKLVEGPQGGNLEASQIRNWMELVLDLPWNLEDEQERIKEDLSRIDIDKAKQILDEDYDGLVDVKNRILEHLAVEKKTKGMKGPILCLVGPPGVGKTSLARSIARCMNRPFVRASLGGVRDEAEIRGHRRTYVGALPGKIISSMKKAETFSPVFLLDEIDKMGISYHGDPAAALLEVLDPEQNMNFEDHYLAIPYDLSKVFFITTANSLDSIPAPLLDRMEIINLYSYTVEEKLHIAQNHLIPKIRKQYNLHDEEWEIKEDAIRKIIENYTREAGVRNLKRILESLARKASLELERNKYKVQIAPENLSRYLGKEKFHKDIKETLSIPGVSIGLAWTSVGGDILYIESTKFPGRGNLQLSGRLGEVMKESANLAFSYLKAHAQEIGIDSSLFNQYDFHIHVPSGAVPKDGPSAGVTILTSIASLLLNIPVSENIAMTGEISLRGKILPVGGIKEKVLAAKAAGIETVLLPEKNKADFEEIQEDIRSQIQVEYYSDMLTLMKRVLSLRKSEKKIEFIEREGW